MEKEKPEISSRVILITQTTGEVLMSLGDSGSVKFIGGRMNPELDESPLEAAIREAREEWELIFCSSTLQSLNYHFKIMIPYDLPIGLVLLLRDLVNMNSIQVKMY